MNVNDYINALRKSLRGCDAAEVENVIQYYTELFEDSDNPQQLMMQFGSPAQLAARIKAENGWAYVKSSKMDTGRIIAIICTSPLWLTAFAFILSILALIVSLYAIFPTMAVGSVPSIFSANGYMPFVTAYIGFMLIGIGGTLLLIKPAIALLKLVVRFALWLFDFIFTTSLLKASERFSSEKKHSFLIGWILGAVFMLAGLSVTGYAAFGMKPDPDEYAAKMNLENTSYQFTAESTSAEIKISGAALEIKSSDDSFIKVEGTLIKEKYLSITDSEKAEITYDAKYSRPLVNFDVFNSLKAFDKSSKVIVYLPEKEYNTLSLSCDLGDLRINGFSSSDLVIDNSCGNVILSDCKAENSRIHLSLGNAEISDSSFTSLDLSENCGKITLDSTTIDNSLTISNDLGETVLNSVTAGSVNASASCGNITVKDSAFTKNAEFTLELGDADISLADSGYDIRLSCELGNAEINGKTASKAKYTHGDTILRVTNDCGDISVSCP